MGIQISSDSVLRYTCMFAEKAPLVKGSGLYGINVLKLLFGANNAGELAEKLGRSSSSALMRHISGRRVH